MATTCNECRSTVPPGLPAFLLDGRELCRNCRDEAEPHCPSCGAVMRRKLPKTYGKCPECGERFFVDQEQQLFDSMLTTREQHEDVKRLEYAAASFEPWGFNRKTAHQMTIVSRRERGDASVDGTLAALADIFARVALKDHPEILESIGAEGVARSVEAIALLNRVRSDAAEQLIRICAVCQELGDQFQMTPSAGDIAWGFLQREELAAAKRSLEELSQIKRQSAMFLAYEGRESRDVLRASYRHKCEAWKHSSDVVRVQVIGAPTDECAAADEINGQVFSIDDAVRNPPIPCESCTRAPRGNMPANGPPWCVCDLRPIFAWE